MTGMDTPGRHMRESGHAREVLPIELFFDLVYVLAVTQLTHYLLEHLTWRGAARHSSCCSLCGSVGFTSPGSATISS